MIIKHRITQTTIIERTLLRFLRLVMVPCENNNRKWRLFSIIIVHYAIVRLLLWCAPESMYNTRKIPHCTSIIYPVLRFYFDTPETI